MCVHARACACMRARVRACARVCVHARARACMRARMRACTRVCDCVCMRMLCVSVYAVCVYIDTHTLSLSGSLVLSFLHMHTRTFIHTHVYLYKHNRTYVRMKESRNMCIQVGSSVGTAMWTCTATAVLCRTCGACVCFTLSVMYVTHTNESCRICMSYVTYV